MPQRFARRRAHITKPRNLETTKARSAFERAAASGFALLLTVATFACAPALMKLPSGPATPAADARDALADATATCAGVRTFSAELGVSGSVGGQGLRGRLLVGVAAPSSARIEAVAPFGEPVFIFVARGDDATLLLPRDDRVLEHGTPDAVLEAVTGVPLDGSGLRRALTGCPAAPDGDSGRAIGDDWRVVRDGPDAVYLHRDARSAPWRTVTIVHDAQARASDGNGQRAAADGAWRAEYREFQNGLPRAVRFVHSDPHRFDLRIELSQVDVNTALGDEVFRVQIPQSAAPISIDELRNARPGLRKN